ncbi:MAG: hypothetical protein AVDCRST_MAG25-2386 [uncultured Rubrobacteraceae bacterium]|uniref:Uncharacterized protein n=1 Tax=uncultured Rubrobacteraceae bacterium TaxID=349277 RepID=A0A6J4RQT9_9ACTN|nr:MAG: hypothetical protein AVDCRST_MAG25-2386 [uncultured Rubrobacteraceae bacterium]
MHPSTTSDDALGLWYALGRLYDGAAGWGRRSTMAGFVVACLVGASVLLSAPAVGTSWAGPYAAAIPVGAGLVFGGGLFGWRLAGFWKRRAALGRALGERGLDARRPTLAGLGAYYDVQLVLLRSGYEYLKDRRGPRARRSVRLLEQTFGFTPEDPFETGPLNVVPDTPAMLVLRERWERRLEACLEQGGPPRVGYLEDATYRIFPREMDVLEELEMRAAYLRISCGLLRERYGKKGSVSLPEDLRRRAERDIREYRAVGGR